MTGGRGRAEKPNGRVLLASVVLMLGLLFYAGLVVNIADLLEDRAVLYGLFLVVAGLAWVWPAVRLIRWASTHRKG